jgi:hypothetical protein
MCNCGKNRIGTRYKVTLASGLSITKSTKEAADAYAAKHPGATVKPA